MNGTELTAVEPLLVLNPSGIGRLGIEVHPGSPPLLGPDGRYFGHEWARWRTDTLDRRVDDLLQAMPGAAVLDVGCASGERAAQFAAAGFRVTGIDIVDHSEAIAARNRRLLAEGGRSAHAITFACSDLAALRQGALSPGFDLVHARRVINFVPADAFDRCFATLSAALRPGGLFVASFISSATGEPDERRHRLPPGTRPCVQLHQGLYAHYLSEVRFALEAHELRISELFSDGQAETGLVARKPAG